ncbi:MAG TPA: SpoIIE family protein phosphatase [Vicinamibacterales bacterium]|nr:SpoIIE family protein phosphatase [Vicinamibacterales bacterium]
MIRAVLVDDEPPARVRMRQLLDAAGGVTVVGEAGSAVEAREVIAATRPDLLFLDVEMPEVRGTALAASLPEPRPFIVFATAYEHYALDAISVDATDYLLKPVSRAKLAATLERVRARVARQNVERDVAAASAVQSQMWPGTLPSIPGFDCAAASLPARGVGGDFYDVFALPGRRGGSSDPPRQWALLLGDASGKGVAAGLVASAVQARVHTAATLAHLEPAPLMAAVDRDVHATTDGARYATAIYGVLDASDARVTLVNAGHPAALLIAADGSMNEIEASGPALGLIEAGTFEPRAITLPSGAILVAYTDGVLDTLDAADDEFGAARLAEVVTRLQTRTASAICTAVLDAVRSHRGHRQDQDDVTIMVIKNAATD